MKQRMRFYCMYNTLIFVCLYVCARHFKWLYRAPPLKQIQQEVTVKDEPRATPQRRAEMPNKLAASNIFFICPSLLVTHSESIFSRLAFLCVHV